MAGKGEEEVIRVSEGMVYVRVRVVPRARKATIDGVHGNALKVRVTAAPVGGAANRALTALLADVLNISPWQVRLVHGERSREKVVAVVGLSPQEVARRLGLTLPAQGL